MSILFKKFIFFAMLAYGAASINEAHATCGVFDGRFPDDKKFVDNSAPGSLAIRRSNYYYLLARSNCTVVSAQDASLRFTFNHLYIGEPKQNAFITVHISIFDPQETDNILQLFRNAKHKPSGWQSDTSNGDYTSLHHGDGTAKLHNDFNNDLSGTRDSFNTKYKSGGRSWIDAVQSDGSTYDAWTSRSDFSVKDEVLRNALDGKIRVRSQNYLINFMTAGAKKEQPLENAPDFMVTVGSSKCLYIRVSGSENVVEAVRSEYVISFNNSPSCDSVISDLKGIGYFSSLFKRKN